MSWRENSNHLRMEKIGEADSNNEDDDDYLVNIRIFTPGNPFGKRSGIEERDQNDSQQNG